MFTGEYLEEEKTHLLGRPRSPSYLLKGNLSTPAGPNAAVRHVFNLGHLSISTSYDIYVHGEGMLLCAL